MSNNNVHTMAERDEHYMREALVLANCAASLHEVPIGALIVVDDQIIGRGFNRREIDKNPLAHAEVAAILEASKKLDAWRLVKATLYVTLEPCCMCAGAIVNSRIERLVFGANDPKAGYAGSLANAVQDSRLNHRVEICSGVLAEECAAVLSEFFKSLRAKK